MRNKISKSRIENVDFDNLVFGKTFTDHMFICHFKNGSWLDPEIKPYQPITIEPSASVFHYGQAVFEGMKAYKDNDGKVWLFRPNENFKRINRSSHRLQIPEFPEEYFFEGLNQLIKLDKDWVKPGYEHSLYIRPFVFASEYTAQATASTEYIFMIICGLAGGYYSEPVNVKIEKKYTRAISGGVGYAKTAANYAAALYPAVEAQKEGYHQLIWTDGKEHNYVEESGTMNLFFVINNTLITPPLGDTVLDGVTRDSIISVCSELDIKVEVRKISVNEIIDSLDKGLMTEAFGAGTAATVAPIKTIGYNSKNYNLPKIDKSGYSQKILDHLNKIKFGKIEDKFGWVTKL